MLLRARKLAAAVAVVLLPGVAGCDRYGSLPGGPLKDERQRVSYASGEQISSKWSKVGADLDLSSVGRGMDDGLAGRMRLMTAQGAEKILGDYSRKQETKTAVGAEEHDRASYAFGYRAANAWRLLKADVDVPSALRGIRDARAQRSLMSPEEGRTLLLRYNEGLLARLRSDRTQLAAKNQQDGAAFLENNRKAPGVVELPSGLQYKVLASGQGDPPGPDSFVSVVYEDRRVDGSLVNDPMNTKKETVLAVGSMIKGWQEALQTMKPGDRRQLFIPGDLAYGMDGASNIGPNATLVTTMELRRVLPERPQLTAEQVARENRDQ